MVTIESVDSINAIKSHEHVVKVYHPSAVKNTNKSSGVVY